MKIHTRLKKKKMKKKDFSIGMLVIAFEMTVIACDKGILVSISALNYVSQVTGVYISEISQWYPWYSNETGAYVFTDGVTDTLELTADSSSYAEMSGTWTR
jgi:hypothetical protein